jgi:hypothetical protein
LRENIICYFNKLLHNEKIFSRLLVGKVKKSGKLAGNRPKNPYNKKYINMLPNNKIFPGKMLFILPTTLFALRLRSLPDHDFLVSGKQARHKATKPRPMRDKSGTRTPQTAAGTTNSQLFQPVTN